MGFFVAVSQHVLIGPVANKKDKGIRHLAMYGNVYISPMESGNSLNTACLSEYMNFPDTACSKILGNCRPPWLKCQFFSS